MRPPAPTRIRSIAAALGAATAATALLAADCDPPPPANDAITADGGRPDAGAAGRPADGGTAQKSYSFVVLPDTQFYSSSWPEIFKAQTQWIVDNRAAEQIAFVLHTGDIVDSDVTAQWEPATQALRILDGQIPYIVTAGNHDYSSLLADRMGMVNSYFPPSSFAQYGWFGDTYEAGHVENSFSVFPAGDGRWLVIGLEFGPRDEVVAWANGVLATFPTTPAIVITHAYLYRDGTRYDFAGTNDGQAYNPHRYVMMGQPGSSVNDGEELWRKLIQPNSNVKLVLSGHDVSQANLPPGTAARLSSTRADGTFVHQILANYQTCLGAPCQTFNDGTATNVVHGGNGYLRIVRVSPADQTISISTYSPYIDRYLTDAANQFTLPMN